MIELGFSAVAIADRVGHESIDITYRYAHLFPAKGKEIANKLDEEREEAFDVTEEQRLSRTLAQDVYKRQPILRLGNGCDVFIS